MKNSGIGFEPILKRNGLFSFSHLTPNDSRLTVKRVRVDEVSETEREKNK